jgi:hypothetical protein
MRSTQRTVEFDFEFQYPRAGHQDMATAITVCEPSFEQQRRLNPLPVTMAVLRCPSG